MQGERDREKRSLTLLRKTEVQLERWEVDQPPPQLFVTLDRSVTSFKDITVSRSKSYVYAVKNFKHWELMAVGYSKRVGF